MIKSDNLQTQSIKKNIMLSTVYQVITLITPFITTPYISRVLGADGIGIYSFTMSIETYFAMFAALGTISYGTREISRARNNIELRSKVFWEIEILSIITTSISILIWCVFVSFSDKYQLYFLILTITLAANLLDISWLFTGLEQLKYIVYRNIIFRLLSIIALFLLVTEKSDIAMYIGINAISTFGGAASMWWSLPKFVHRVPFSSLQIKRHFRETLVYFIPTIATSVYTVLDKTLIGMITSDIAENGYYEQATKIIRMGQTLTFSALNTVLGARISYLFKEKRYEEIHKRIYKSIDFILFMGCLLMFGIIGAADVFVPWFFGQGFEPVVLFMQVMSPIILIIGVSNCLGSHYYTPAGLRKISAKFIIAGACFNLVLNLILIPQYAGLGAIIASLAAELLISILYLRNCDGYLTIKVLKKYSWKKVVSGLIALAIAYMLQESADELWLILLMQSLSIVFVYCAMLIVLKDSSLQYIVALLRIKMINHKV